MRALFDCGLFALISVITYLLLGAIPRYKVALKSSVWPYSLVSDILTYHILDDYPYYKVRVGDGWCDAKIIAIDVDNNTVTFDRPVDFTPYAHRSKE